VPQGWAEDPPLANWVMNQRAYKRQLDRGEPCRGMTAARVAKLEALGFAWELSLNEYPLSVLAKLKAYKRRHGDCNVPQGWAEDPPLANWVMNQRSLKRKLDHGEPCKWMTAARAATLDALGFDWAKTRRVKSK
jgi:hypothetical protein